MITLEERKKIREVYANVDLTPKNGYLISPYLGFDWFGKFSPIEDRVWASIRYLCLPLYPQYPVGPFFVDFADPIRKLGIEVDSKRWHQDLAKDQARQEKIESLGWEVVRIPSMTVAVKELEQMCIDNAEPIRFYCWNCGTHISADDKPVHDALKHDVEPEGEPA